MEFKAHLEERTSKKSGKTYCCIVINITPKVEKVLFLDDTDVELIRLAYGKNEK